MRKIPLLSIALIALAAASCARQQQSYVIDPATGQPVPVVAQQAYAGPQFAQQTSDGGERGLFNSRRSTQPVYAQPQLQQPTVI